MKYIAWNSRALTTKLIIICLVLFAVVYILDFRTVPMHGTDSRDTGRFLFQKGGDSNKKNADSLSVFTAPTYSEKDIEKILDEDVYDTNRQDSYKYDQREESKMTNKTDCHVDRNKFRGRMPVSTEYFSFWELQHYFWYSRPGGRFYPVDCIPRKRIAIIIPYRDRDTHLKAYMFNVIPKLKKQMIDFTFYVIEQAPGAKFNRGMMRNIGFVEAQKDFKFDCYVFNDVDSIPEDDHNMYECYNDSVHHLVTGVDRDKYRLKYSTLVGGIIAFTREQFIKVNGYSNFYFDWGAEDDDIYNRINYNNLTISRPSDEVGLITTMGHKRDPEIKTRFRILWSRDEASSRKDGVNNLKYKTIVKEYRPLYTWIYVSVDMKAVMKDLVFKPIPKKSTTKGK